MTKNLKEKSACCGAEIDFPAFPKKNGELPLICSKCHRICNPAPEPQEDWEKLKYKNWHIIVGPNGECECGEELGVCGDRLRYAVTKELDAIDELLSQKEAEVREGMFKEFDKFIEGIVLAQQEVGLTRSAEALRTFYQKLTGRLTKSDENQEK